MGIRFKRIIAFIIDWNITLFPFVFAFVFLTTFFEKESSAINILIALLCFLSIISAIALFILRDVIFKGRSLGKRIFKLYVYDKISLQKATSGQCFLRNIFLFIYVIDGIVLLATGDSIGDMAAKTVVLSDKTYDKYKQSLETGINIDINNAVQKKKSTKKLWLVIAVVIACLIAFLGIIQLALNAQKDTEQYKVAYNYFVQSEAFKQLNVDEEKIIMNRYSLQSSSSAKDNAVSTTVQIEFTVKFKSFEVVCHRQNGIWSVCEECTAFN